MSDRNHEGREAPPPEPPPSLSPEPPLPPLPPHREDPFAGEHGAHGRGSGLKVAILVGVVVVLLGALALGFRYYFTYMGS